MILLKPGLRCIRKVFRPLDFFHILLQPYSKILIELFFVPHHQSTHTANFFFQQMNNKKPEITHLRKYSDPLLSTLLKHLWQRLQPLSLPVFGEFLPIFSADPLNPGLRS